MESVTDSDGSANAAEGRLGNTMLSAWDVVAVAVYLVLVMTAGILVSVMVVYPYLYLC